MPDIFLSYNREDQARAKIFAEAFQEHGFDVWWDVGLRTGEAYDQVTEKALREAKAVVVLWSKRSVESRWVRAEATLADRNRTLVPVMIEPCERPIMFELTQTADLANWTGDPADQMWLAFLADTRRFVGAAVPGAKPVQQAIAAPVTGPYRGSRPSLAILPFTNRSGERADDVFASGMVEDLIGALSLGRGIKVIAQSATYAYRKGASDLRAIGHELGVRYVMEGNVRRVGDSLRVTAQLVEAENGAILWTQKFDRPLQELAFLQEELVTEVAAHLGVQIQRVEFEKALKKPGDLTAWEAVMRSWASYAKFSPDGVRVCVAEARKAVALAPDYAIAHATLGFALVVLFYMDGYRSRALAAEALDHAERALALDANNATVLFQVGAVFINCSRWPEALQYAQRAVELNPSLSVAHEMLGTVLIRHNRIDEALAELDEMEVLAPKGNTRFVALWKKSWAHYVAGRLDKALDCAKQSSLLNPSMPFVLQVSIVALEGLGRREEAQDMLRRLRKLDQAAPLDLQLDRIRGFFLPAAAIQSATAAFENVWNATPIEPTAA